jgi:glycosyltransferase involved in cell wall biosynthesis
MRILLTSYAFPPSVGGIESISVALAEQFVRCGHEVRVVTAIRADDDRTSYGFEVTRRPGAAQLVRLVRWSEIVFHNNISLRYAWPMLFLNRPWVITHATWIEPGIAGTMKRFASRFATNVAISRAIAEGIAVPSTLIHNPYDSSLFRPLSRVRDRELIFVGRLIHAKGIHVLLRALAQIRQLGLRPRLTIVGGGPEEAALRRMTTELGLAEAVTFAGVKRGQSLVNEMARHLIMVVPSLWNEPFGIVALEGLACGCAIVGSNGGGLADAIGPCGLTFPNGDAHALAQCLLRLLSSDGERNAMLQSVPEHLEEHSVQHIAEKYLDVFSAAMNARAGKAKKARE